MTYLAKEARQELLDAVAETVEEIAVALADLGAAYEQLDEMNGDRLEEELFRPIQVAYGRAKRAYTGFAERYDLPTRTFEPAAPGSASRGVKGLLETSVDAVAQADALLVTLQDSMMPVEVGDAQLRAELADVRAHLVPLAAHARQFVRTLGR